MPLKVNVPTGRKDWKLTKCPECGAQCWELPLAEVAKAQGAKGLCTMCALKKGVSARMAALQKIPMQKSGDDHIRGISSIQGRRHRLWQSRCCPSGRIKC